MRKLFSSLVLFFCFLPIFAQMQNPVKFTVSQTKLSDSEFEIVFKGQIEAGWHVYSTDIASGGPTAATVEFDEIKGAEPVGKLKPTGHVIKKFDEMFGMDVTYMEGTASFTQKMRITGPTYTVNGYLNYGACNDENCIPPSQAEFSYSGKGVAKAAEAADKDVKEQEEAESKEEMVAVDTMAVDSMANVATVQQNDSALAGVSDYWAPVIDDLAAFGESASNATSQAWWMIFLLGFLGGLVALLTPCVWPIIPMTVSFFLKRSGDKKKGVRDAFI